MLVKTKEIEFDWHMGMSFSVRQRSLTSLHENIKKLGIAKNPLEISSKSFLELGVKLSAFNLSGKLKGKNKPFTVETIFQSCKKFKNDELSPYRDLLTATSREAKTDPRLKNKELDCFIYPDGTIWELEPKTAFYDWLYLNVLIKHNSYLAEQISGYDAFTDIEFNHQKSINCQAHSVALFKALEWRGNDLLLEACSSKNSFLSIINDFILTEEINDNIQSQTDMFLYEE